jgi:hypothetical protein
MRARLRRGVAVAALPLTIAALAAAQARPGVADKSLFVSITDAQGRPVPDVRLGDMLIREDGQDREIVAIKPASQPISVVVLVDTAQGRRVTDAYGMPEEYVRDIRVSMSSFAKQLLSRSADASVMLMEFGQAAIPVVPFTHDLLAFEKGVNTLAAKPGVGSVLMEAINAANAALAARPSPRRAIVSLNLEPSDEQSRESEARRAVETFRASGAQLWSISVQRGGLKNSRRDLVINEFAKATGGQRDFVVAIAAVPGILRRYADVLAAQYEIVYKRPESNRRPQLIQVGTLLQNVKTHASGFPPE